MYIEDKDIIKILKQELAEKDALLKEAVELLKMLYAYGDYYESARAKNFLQGLKK